MKKLLTFTSSILAIAAFPAFADESLPLAGFSFV